MTITRMNFSITKKYTSFFIGAIKVIGILFFLGFGTGFFSFKPMPPHALVIPDAGSRTYVAPVCLEHTEELPTITAKQASSMNFKPDIDCINTGAFQQELRSLSGRFLEWLGLLEPLSDRWNSDGTWNY